MVYLTCGYSGTGSSALVHLLSEYSNCTKGKLGTYEHILFYTPNGLFDLEDRLLLNNSIHGADGAISEFRKAMMRLYNVNFGWFGGLKKLYGNRFLGIVEEFIEELIDYKIPGCWSYDIEMKRSLPKFAKQTVLKLLGHSVPHYGYKACQTGDGVILFSFITPERFYAAARKFVAAYIAMVSDDSDKCFICDQLFQPHHLGRMKNYFAPDEAKAIVVDRDARDMFVLGKYVWPSMRMPVAFPKEPEVFARFYQALISSAQVEQSESVLPVHFEDLIYKYEDTIEKIESFAGHDLGTHDRAKEVFVPEKSIKNTQNFRIQPEWTDEVKIIEDMVPELTYAFPYELKPKLKETTDP